MCYTIYAMKRKNPSGDEMHPPLRLGAGVVLLDEENRVLLFRRIEPDDESGRPVWLTPGGGLEPGETYGMAARRELLEEAGIVLAEIGPILWIRMATWRYRGNQYRSFEKFFLGYYKYSEHCPSTTDLQA